MPSGGPEFDLSFQERFFYFNDSYLEASFPLSDFSQASLLFDLLSQTGITVLGIPPRNLILFTL